MILFILKLIAIHIASTVIYHSLQTYKLIKEWKQNKNRRNGA